MKLEHTAYRAGTVYRLQGKRANINFALMNSGKRTDEITLMLIDFTAETMRMEMIQRDLFLFLFKNPPNLAERCLQ